MARINKRTRFTVEGSGAFPFDMLRYDHAWPEKEATDSYQLGLTLAFGDAYLNTRRVTLLTDSPHAPNEARWRSFTWSVVNVEKVT